MAGAFSIKLDRIEPDPNQPRKRIDPTRLDELTSSIRRLGILQPITVRYVEDADRYRIIAGECRFTAAKRAGLSELPCWVQTPDEQEVLLHQVVENWQRSDLNPFELADSLNILRNSHGCSQQELAEMTGKSKGEISKLLAMLELDPEVQAIARQDQTGHLSKRHLYALARLPANQQQTVMKRIQDQKLTVSDLERLVERHNTNEQKSDRRGPQYFRRSFRTSKARVVFSCRTDSVADHDIRDTIHEIEQQLSAGHSDG